jgi:hypothetical protein
MHLDISTMGTKILKGGVLAGAIAVSAACGGAASATSPAAPAAESTPATSTSLDGQSYEVTLLFPGEAPIKDTLRFTDGKFESTACTSLGFPQWSDYSAKGASGSVAFQAVTHHPAGATMEWSGTSVSGSIEGSAKRTMNGQVALATFRGTTSR